MIKERDVIRMKVPYPSINSRLAVQAHMYICKSSDTSRYSFVKCQTLKPYMLINNPLKPFIDEPADIRRNPFSRTTRIDCDKLFSTEKVKYDDALLATRRRDVCEELYDAVTAELEQDGWENVAIDDGNKLVSLNQMITRIL